MRSVFFSQARLQSEGWKAEALPAGRQALMTGVNASDQLGRDKRWMISQGQYQGQGGKRILHEFWAYQTGADPKVSVQDLGTHKRITVEEIPGVERSGYQIKVPGKLLGITSRQTSLRITKVQ
jgi:HSP20 family molecular chaperone IbpA